MLNVAMLSKWHVHAAGYARELMNMDDVHVTCIWTNSPNVAKPGPRNWAWRLSPI